MTKNKVERVLYLDILRIFSIFCMMVLHVAAVSWHDVSVTSYEWNILNFYDGIVRFCVPVFIMISGAFLLNPEKKYTIKSILSKKIFRMITAFAFWSASYAFLRTYIMTYVNSGDINLHTFISFVRLFVLGNYHLWFIFTLIGLYLIAPFLRKITENKRLMQYFLLLAFLFVGVKEILHIVPALEPTLVLLEKKMSFFFVMGYTGYFVAGYYLFRYDISRISKIILYILGIISVFITVYGTHYLSYLHGSVSAVFYSYTIPTTTFAAVAMFIFFKDVISKIKFKERSTRNILLLSKLSFGMYLFHDYMNIMFRYLGIKTIDFNPLISVPIMSLIVFGGSFVVIYLLHKIPKFHKYIM